jgi:hypothetical protein
MWTGVNVFNVTGSASGSQVMGPSGEQLRYNFYNNGTTGSPDYYLTIWNSSKMFTGTGFVSGTGLSPGYDTSTGTSRTTWAWQNTTSYVNNVLTVSSVNVTTITPGTTAINATRGIRYETLDPITQNATIASWRNTMTSSTTMLTIRYGDKMICRNGSYPQLTGVTQNVSNIVSLTMANWTYFAVNLNASKGPVGSILWWSPTYSSLQDKTITYGGADPVAGVFVDVCKETLNIVGYSYDNGAKLWETNEVNDIKQTDITPLDYFGNPAYPYVATQPAYGKLYSLSYGGILYCYDLETGQRLWSNGNGGTPGNNTSTGLAAPGPHPAFINAVGNDVIYTVATQHTTITPISKSQMNRAINATSGEEIWAISAYVGEFFTMSYAMADGYCNWFNGYDNQIYTVGRGPSTMTVSAPDLAAASGQPVVIDGSVLDISAGSKQDEQSARFPNGIPLAADSVMTDWMGYVYQQKPLPMTFTGVTVNIDVIDSNGNYRTIGTTTTTDAKGQYNLIWTPDISGNYQVIASFAGTNGYWPSSATTAFNVMEAAATPTPVPTTPPTMADLYFVPAIAGLFVFVAIIGVVIILVLSKRP